MLRLNNANTGGSVEVLKSRYIAGTGVLRID